MKRIGEVGQNCRFGDKMDKFWSKKVKKSNIKFSRKIQSKDMTSSTSVLQVFIPQGKSNQRPCGFEQIKLKPFITVTV